jgi:two-component system response regulator AtoC
MTAMPPQTVLVVDDDEAFAGLVAEQLVRAGFAVLRAGDGQTALEVLRERQPDAMLVDLQMPRLGGLALVEILARQDRLPPTVVMSAFGTQAQALEAIRLGALDFLPKPFRLTEVELKLKLALARSQPVAKPAAIPMLDAEFHGMVGQSPAMRTLFGQIERVARYPSTVLISGESGTGKELVARALHDASPRHKGPFVAVNCGAIPPALLESELFGHVRGAFTDAHADRKGLFEEAHQGTLLLDEIVELPLHLQVKLLRVLQEGEVRRVGGNRAVPVDVRVLAASAVPVRQRVRDGLFREDLLYRLAVIELQVPALRQRPDDIPLLVRHLIARNHERLHTPATDITPQALAALAAQPWPGNVRELYNRVEQACVMADGPVLELAHLQLAADSTAEPPAADALSIPRAVAAVEKSLILAALAQTGGNRTRAAGLLQISVRSLQERLKTYGVEVAAPVGRPKS